jgi:hypothetical protein
MFSGGMLEKDEFWRFCATRLDKRYGPMKMPMWGGLLLVQRQLLLIHQAVAAIEQLAEGSHSA